MMDFSKNDRKGMIMRQIRTGVFETNSSSTHSIIISDDRKKKLFLPEKISFGLGNYGWEHRVLSTPEEKASYLYTSIVCAFEKWRAEEYKNQIYAMLSDAGVKCDFEEVVYKSYGRMLWPEHCGVDHVGEHDHLNFIEKTVENPKRLLRYLFSDESYVVTGNDNEEEYYPELLHPSYPHEIYYKGN